MCRVKAAFLSGCKSHPAVFSSRKQSEQSWSGQYGKGQGGMKHGGAQHGKEGHEKYRQVVQRLDMIEARMAKIKVTLEILMRR